MTANLCRRRARFSTHLEFEFDFHDLEASVENLVKELLPA